MVIKSLCSVAITKVSVTPQVDLRPSRFLIDTTVPAIASALNWAFQVGKFSIVAFIASTPQRIRALSILEDRLRWASVVVLSAGSKSFFIVQKGRTSVIAALLAVGRKRASKRTTIRVHIAHQTSPGDASHERK